MNAVIFGAGNIGRGFLGQLFYEASFNTIFIDINKDLLNKINSSNSYNLCLISNDFERLLEIKNVCAINGSNITAVANAVKNADIICTAVGVRALPFIVKGLAAGLIKRTEAVDIIICENLKDADKLLKELVIKEESGITNVGFVEASIGRMVPASLPQQDIQYAEPYGIIPIDADAMVRKLDIKGFIPSSPFEFYIERKLFLHNMSHTFCAWLGAKKGYTHIYEAIADNEIYNNVRDAMAESSNALSKKYSKPYAEIFKHAEELLERYKNKRLADPISRVGGDVERKLGKNDRIYGAINLCKEQNMPYEHISLAIEAGEWYINNIKG